MKSSPWGSTRKYLVTFTENGSVTVRAMSKRDAKRKVYDKLNDVTYSRLGYFLMGKIKSCKAV